MRTSERYKQIEPYIIGTVNEILAARNLGSSSGGGSSTLTAHALSSASHTGTLADSQAPQFLKTDGSRNLTGNLGVDASITIDGVDISAHAVASDAHHDPVTAGSGISLSTQQVSVNQAYAFTWTAEHTHSQDIQLGADLDFTGSNRSITTATDENLLINTPGAGKLIFPEYGMDLRTNSSVTGFLGKGWQLNNDDEGWSHFDVRSMYAEELRVTAFIADIARVQVGETFIAQSMALIGAPDDANIVVNPTFNQGTDNWSSTWGDTLTQDTTNPQSGANHLRVTADGSSGSGAWQRIYVVPGKQYVVTGWIYNPTGWTGGNPSIIVYDGDDFVGSLGSSTTVSAKDTWTQVSVTVTPTENVVRMVFFAGGATVNTEYWYVDTVDVHRADGTYEFVTPATGNDVRLWVEDTPGFVGETLGDGDYVLIRFIDRTGGGLIATSLWGQVYDGFDDSSEYQFYRFTRRSGGATGLVAKTGSIVIDMGNASSGQRSYIHASAIDNDAPWTRYADWDTNPYTPSNINVHVQVGNLDGVTDTDLNPSGYGLYADSVFLKGTLRTDTGEISDNGMTVFVPSSTSFDYDSQYAFAFEDDADNFRYGGLYTFHNDSSGVDTRYVNLLVRDDSPASAHDVEMVVRAEGDTVGRDARLYLRAQAGGIVGDTNAVQWYLESSDSTGTYQATLMADQATISAPLDVAGHVLPTADETYNLGSASKQWSTIYADQLIISGSISGETLDGAEWEYAGDIVIDANTASTTTTVSVVNQGAGGVANLDVENNIIVGGTVDGVDIASHDASASAHHNEASGGTSISVDGSQVVSLVLNGTSGLEVSSGLRIRDDLAGNGLTMAGKIMAVGAGAGIDVAADSISVDVTDLLGAGISESSNNFIVDRSFSPTWTGTHTFDTNDVQMDVNLDFTGSNRAITTATDEDLYITPGGAGNLWFPEYDTNIRTQNAVQGFPGKGWSIDNDENGYSKLDIREVFTENLRAHSFIADFARVRIAEDWLGQSAALIGGDGTTSLVKNNAFNNGTTHWSTAWGDTLSVETGETQAGANALRITADGTTGSGAYQRIQVEPGRSYTFSLYIYNRTGWTGGNPQLIVYDGDDFVGSLGSSTTVSAKDTWTLRSVTFVPTEHEVRLVCFASGSTTNNEYWFVDTASVYRDDGGYSFIVPDVGQTTRLWVEDSPGFSGLAFADGDYLIMQPIDRSGGGVTYATLYFEVIDSFNASGDYQQYDVELVSDPIGNEGLVVGPGVTVVDLGNPSSGERSFIQSSVADSNGPFTRYMDWSTNPWTPANRNLHVQVGNLDGISDTELSPSGFGLYGTNVFLKGSLVAGSGGEVVIDGDGILVKADDTINDINSYLFLDDSSNSIARVAGQYDSLNEINAIQVEAMEVGNRDSVVFLYAESSGLSGAVASIDMSAVDNSTTMAEFLLNASGNGLGLMRPGLWVHQNGSSANIPSLYLQQDDISEEFIRFLGGVDGGKPIQTGALGAYYGKVRVHVDGVGDKWMALYD